MSIGNDGEQFFDQEDADQLASCIVHDDGFELMNCSNDDKSEGECMGVFL